MEATVLYLKAAPGVQPCIDEPYSKAPDPGAPLILSLA